MTASLEAAPTARQIAALKFLRKVSNFNTEIFPETLVLEQRIDTIVPETANNTEIVTFALPSKVFLVFNLPVVQ